MTTKEMMISGATVYAAKGMREYLKWYMRNVWKCRAMAIGIIIAIVIGTGIGIALRAGTINEQHIVEDKTEEQNILEYKMEELYDRYVVTTVGNHVKIVDGHFDSEVVSYDREMIGNIWMSLGESRVFREGWKKNFQISDTRWIDPEGKIATWHYIAHKAENSRKNVYFGYMDINGEKLRIPEEIDTNNDLWLIDIDKMQTAKIEVYDGIVEYTEYDADGNVEEHIISEDEYAYEEMKNRWFE